MLDNEEIYDYDDSVDEPIKPDLWKEEFDENGRSSLQTHTLKTVWTSCKKNECYFEITGNREATCKKCGAIKEFVVGHEKLVDGKFIPLK